jgi:hypothetical protein
LHLEQCGSCSRLKEKVEELMYAFPDLEEEVPFFLKNRLHYIPESQQVIEMPESRFYYLKWVAAAIGTFVLFLNLFYFTNIYPPANRFLHTAVSKIETFTVETGAFFERLKESKNFVVFSFLKGDSDDEDEDASENVKVEEEQTPDTGAQPGGKDKKEGNEDEERDEKDSQVKSKSEKQLSSMEEKNG